MTTTGISGSSYVNATTINYRGAVTPEALMVYCSSRLHGLDDEMQGHFEKQQQYRAVTAGMNSIQAMLSEWSNRPNGYEGNNAAAFEEWNTLHEKFADVYRALPPGSSEAKRIHELEDKLSRKVLKELGGKEGLSKDDAKTLGDEAGAISKDMSSNAELDMITLQSLMSQRQTAIQLCTNLVSSLGESSKAIAQKVGS